MRDTQIKVPLAFMGSDQTKWTSVLMSTTDKYIPFIPFISYEYEYLSLLALLFLPVYIISSRVDKFIIEGPMSA